MYPSLASSFKARAVVIRLTEYCSINSNSVGTFVPKGNAPAFNFFPDIVINFLI